MPPITMTSVNLSEEAAKLLDFSQKLDINLLDNIVTMMYTGNGQQVFTTTLIWIIDRIQLGTFSFQL